MKAWGTANRYAGSKDRRAIADRVYKVLRARGRLSWIMGGREDGRALVIGSLHAIDGLPLEEIEALHSGDGYGPRPLSKQERSRITAGQGELPGWVAAGLPEFVVEDFKAVFGERWAGEAHALMAPRAPIDLRVNGAVATVQEVETELREAGLDVSRTPWSEWGLRVPSEPPPNIQAMEGFKAGKFEIQDEGSQVVCWLAGAEPGATVVDYCAGGGGKTLGLAQAMGGQGKLVASDVVNKRLENIRPRLQRAGVEGRSGPDRSERRRSGGPERSGRSGLRRCALFGFRHLASSPRGRLASDGGRGREAARPAGPHPGSGGQAGETGRTTGLCDLLDAGA